jgi:glycosyltransferase involved in cell wall biosynthesis
MKVAQVCPRYYPYLGGVETNVKKVSESLASKGIKLEVLTTDPTDKLPKEETNKNVLIRRFKSRAPMEAFYFSGELKSYLKKHFTDYDVIHAHSYHDFPALYAAQAKKVSIDTNLLVFTPHYHGKGRNLLTSLLHTFYKPVYGQKIFNQADIVICVSNYEKKLVEENFPRARNKILTIPNGVEMMGGIGEVPNFPTGSSKSYILYVGRVESYQRVDRLVRALGYLSRKDVSLVIVGNGPAKDNIVKLARDTRVQDRIEFCENLSEGDLDVMYRNASALVNLSKFEAYGLAVAEALARGTPCIVATSSALAEWVDNVNCFGVDDPSNPQLVARTIDGVIGKRASGVKLLSWDDVAQKLIDVYNRKLVP